MGIFGALIVLCWICSFSPTQMGKLLRNSPVSVLSLCLMGLFLAGLFYTPVPIDDGFDALKKYRELIFIPIVMVLLCENIKIADTAVLSFFIGCIILLVISYAMAAGLLPSTRYGHSLVYHITHSFFMAILAFWVLHKLFDRAAYRFFFVMVLIAVVGNIIYIAPGRTGMITFLTLILLFLWQRFQWKKLMMGLVLFVFFVLGAVFSSDNFAGRLEQAIHEVQTYEHGLSTTSLGMRFDWWAGSLKLIEQEPIFGHGTGSFKLEHNLLIKGSMVKSTDNPHNEYLFIAVQLGLLGLLLYIALFFAQWYYSYKLPNTKRWLVQGVILSMAAGCIMNSFLFDSHQGHYYAFLTAILLTPHAAFKQN